MVDVYIQESQKTDTMTCKSMTFLGKRVLLLIINKVLLFALYDLKHDVSPLVSHGFFFFVDLNFSLQEREFVNVSSILLSILYKTEQKCM